MADAAGLVLNLSAARAEELLAEAGGAGVFPEVVPDFGHSRSVPLTCLISVGGRSITHIAPGRRWLARKPLPKRSTRSQDGAFYDSKPIVAAALGFQHGRSAALAYDDISGGSATVKPKLGVMETD